MASEGAEVNCGATLLAREAKDPCPESYQVVVHHAPDDHFAVRLEGHGHPARDARQPGTTLGKNLFPRKRAMLPSHLRYPAVCPLSRLPGVPASSATKTNATYT